MLSPSIRANKLDDGRRPHSGSGRTSDGVHTAGKRQSRGWADTQDGRLIMTAQDSKAGWFDEGMVLAGIWEPLRDRYRRFGDYAGQARRIYEEEQSEKALDALQAAGVNLVLTHFYKGFGADAEQQGMQDTKAFADLCHARGMRVGVYVQTVSSIYYETFFRDVPESRHWVSRDQNGRIPTYGAQYYRYIACPTCEPYLDYIEQRVLTYAVQEVEADLVHFDNLRWWPEPDACRCERCTQRFRDFLEAAWRDPEARFSHFGLEDFTCVQPPSFHPLVPVWDVPVFRDPLFQAWFDFKSGTLAALYKRFADFLTGLNPDVIVECNVDLKCGSNNAVNRGAWGPAVYRHGRAFWTEKQAERGISETGSLMSKIRNLKLGQATNNAVFTYNETRLTQAESMAFNRNCLGMIGNTPNILNGKHEDTKPYIEFFHDHNDLFRNTESAADVAVLYSYPTLCYTSLRPQRELVLAEQTLIEEHVPYDIVFDDLPDTLSPYRAVVVPDVLMMSDNTVEALAAYVRQGGGVLLTGRPGRESEYGCRRHSAPFDESLGIDTGEQPETGSEPHLCAFGKGRLAYLAGLEPSVSPALFPPHPVSFTAPWFDNRWWKAPRNAPAFMNGLTWAADGLNMTVEAPRTLVAEWREQPSAHRLLLHLVNYDDTPVQQVTCTIRAAVPGDVSEFSVLSPDTDRSRPAPLTRQGDSVSFTVGPVERYSIVAIPTGAAAPASRS